jgi:ribonuclease D
MTSEQLLYADTDVLYLGKLLEALMGPSGVLSVF